jgi:hypothetical protein
MPKSSTEKAFFKLIEELLKFINNKQFFGGIFCDLNKAFNCVSHYTLTKKLEFHGITGKFSALTNIILYLTYTREILDRFLT